MTRSWFFVSNITSTCAQSWLIFCLVITPEMDSHSSSPMTLRWGRNMPEYLTTCLRLRVKLLSLLWILIRPRTELRWEVSNPYTRSNFCTLFLGNLKWFIAHLFRLESFQVLNMSSHKKKTYRKLIQSEWEMKFLPDANFAFGKRCNQQKAKRFPEFICKSFLRAELFSNHKLRRKNVCSLMCTFMRASSTDDRIYSPFFFAPFFLFRLEIWID